MLFYRRLSRSHPRCEMLYARQTTTGKVLEQERWEVRSVGKWKNVNIAFDANTKTQINFSAFFSLLLWSSRWEIINKTQLKRLRENFFCSFPKGDDCNLLYYCSPLLNCLFTSFLGIHNTMMKFHISKTKTLSQHL